MNNVIIKPTLTIRQYQNLTPYADRFQEMKNLTEQRLARILNKPILYIQDIEQGRYILGIVEFLEYCGALGVDPNTGIQVIENYLKNCK